MIPQLFSLLAMASDQRLFFSQSPRGNGDWKRIVMVASGIRFGQAFFCPGRSRNSPVPDETFGDLDGTTQELIPYTIFSTQAQVDDQIQFCKKQELSDPFDTWNSNPPRQAFMFPVKELPTCRLADADHQPGFRGNLRTFRRIIKRCWLNREIIGRRRVFCQNSGACGSTYIVRLLQSNQIPRVFHEKTPDLLNLGLQHFEAGIGSAKIIRMLRYTRHNVDFEANNRLFSLSVELAKAFPNARFLYLYRAPDEAIRSAMSKPNLDEYFRSNIRFRGSLAGPHEADYFSRFCHHWANMNSRIIRDLNIVRDRGHKVDSINFDDLVIGNVDILEEMLGRSLDQKICPPANVRPVGEQGRFPKFQDWTSSQKDEFEQICRPVWAKVQTFGLTI